MYLTLILVGLLLFLPNEVMGQNRVEDRIVSYVVDPSQQTLQFFWKDPSGKNYANAKKLQAALQAENKALLFAVNGGMYLKDRSPQGLYIEKGKTLKKLNTVKEAYGNFYLQPNGVFYLTDEQKAGLCPTNQFEDKGNICYATQSGPMLVIDGQIHPKFTKGSSNVHIRNGVGILPDGKILFAISTETINLYDFASFFKNQGCNNALYLDGFVSRMYLPVKSWEQMDGNFGVIIGEVESRE
jgi:uncharacterized protein YigE (DUF2233 family)